MREWLIIEDSRKNGVFAPAESQTPKGYIPRDTAEALLGRDLGGTVWFTREESDRLRRSPEWRSSLDGDLCSFKDDYGRQCRRIGGHGGAHRV